MLKHGVCSQVHPSLFFLLWLHLPVLLCTAVDEDALSGSHHVSELKDSFCCEGLNVGRTELGLLVLGVLWITAYQLSVSAEGTAWRIRTQYWRGFIGFCRRSKWSKKNQKLSKMGWHPVHFSDTDENLKSDDSCSCWCLSTLSRQKRRWSVQRKNRRDLLSTARLLCRATAGPGHAHRGCW